jgi:glutathione S-transferase
MKLYSVDRSPFGSRVRAAVEFKGLRVETLEAPEGGLKSPAYLAINPLGKLPTLVLDDGRAIPESQVILDYLEEIAPSPSLYPVDAVDNAMARLIPRMIDLYLLPALFELFAHLNPAGRDDDAVTSIFGRFGAALDHVEHYVADEEFAVGGTFSAADCALVPALFWVATVNRLVGREAPGARPKLAAYWDMATRHPLLGPLAADMKTDLAKVLPD